MCSLIDSAGSFIEIYVEWTEKLIKSVIAGIAAIIGRCDVDGETGRRAGTKIFELNNRYDLSPAGLRLIDIRHLCISVSDRVEIEWNHSVWEGYVVREGPRARPGDGFVSSIIVAVVLGYCCCE